jgi:hypothetical protein
MCEPRLRQEIPKYDLSVAEILVVIKSPFQGFTSIGCLKCQKFANIPRCAVYLCPQCGTFYLIKRSSCELEAYPDYGPKREQLINILLDNIDIELDPHIRLSQVAKLNAIPMDFAIRFSQGEINEYLRGFFRLKNVGTDLYNLLIHKDDVRSFYERIRAHKIVSGIKINV